MRKRVVLLMALLLLAATAAASGALAESAAPAQIDLTGLCNAVIALLGALVTYRLVPWLKARTTAQQQEMLQAGIRTAVYAAEQLYKTDVIADRLDYALKWLGSHGYSVDRAQVEAAVKEMQLNRLELAPLELAAETTLETEDTIDE